MPASARCNELGRLAPDMTHRQRGALTARCLLLSVALLCAVPAAAREPLAKATPAETGFSAERLALVKRALEAEVEKGRIPGVVIAIARKGRLAYLEAVGFRDKDKGEPMAHDTIFAIASMTKPMTSVAILMLYEDGRLMLSDPVTKYLPALADMKVGSLKTLADGKIEVETRPARRTMTIQDLLRHTSGLTYREFGNTEIDKLHPPGVPPLTMSGPEFLAALAKAPLHFDPGKAWNYSLSTDVLGLVVEAVAGKPLGAFLSERLWQPLGMSDTSFAVPPEKKRRQAVPFANDPLTGKPQFVLHTKSDEILRFHCGGACAVSTAQDYLRFTEMLRNGGTYAGVRVMGRKTVELMTADHLSPAMHAETRSPILAPGYGFGLGVSPRLSAGVANLSGTAGEYNWGGAWGTYFWVDPKEQMSVVFMSQQGGDMRVYLRQLLKSLVLQAIAD
jgi:CubicO group peptidase (beta-lactamase class C family)